MALVAKGASQMYALKFVLFLNCFTKYKSVLLILQEDIASGKKNKTSADPYLKHH